MKIIKKNKGFSLIEMIVYLAIFTGISVLVINSFIVISSSYATIRSNHDLLESASNSMERIGRDIRQASSVDTANSLLGVSNGSLQLNSTDSSGNPMTIRFTLTNGMINLYENGVLVNNLLGQNIRATNLTFRNIITTEGQAVKIEMTIQNQLSKQQQSINLYNTIILRDSY